MGTGLGIFLLGIIIEDKNTQVASSTLKPRPTLPPILKKPVIPLESESPYEYKSSPHTYPKAPPTMELDADLVQAYNLGQAIAQETNKPEAAHECFMNVSQTKNYLQLTETIDHLKSARHRVALGKHLTRRARTESLLQAVKILDMLPNQPNPNVVLNELTIKIANLTQQLEDLGLGTINSDYINGFGTLIKNADNETCLLTKQNLDRIPALINKLTDLEKDILSKSIRETIMIVVGIYHTIISPPLCVYSIYRAARKFLKEEIETNPKNDILLTVDRHLEIKIDKLEQKFKIQTEEADSMAKSIPLGIASTAAFLMLLGIYIKITKPTPPLQENLG